MTLNRSDDGPITWLSFAKPPVNSLDSATILQLIEALSQCVDDPQTRVVVLGGEGRHFCAGADLHEQQAVWREGGSGAADLGVALYTAMLSFPKPLIGMAHGAVVGAGLSIIACCDLAVAAHGTRISLPEVNVGVLGGVSHARAVLGKATAHYLALTGLPIAVEKLGHTGLFVDIVPADTLRDTARTIALAIAGQHPEAVRFTKRCMRTVEGVGQLEGYTRESALGVALRDSGVSDELIQAFLDRR